MTDKTFFRLWSEWDIGENYVIFKDKEAGMRWLLANVIVAELAELDEAQDVPSYITNLFERNNIGWETVTVFQ